MSDEELLSELQEKAMGLGMDIRWLINELIKQYRIRCFDVQALSGCASIGERPREIFGYCVDDLVLVADLLRQHMVSSAKLKSLVSDYRRMHMIIVEGQKQGLLEGGDAYIARLRPPELDEVMKVFVEGKFDGAGLREGR